MLTIKDLQGKFPTTVTTVRLGCKTRPLTGRIPLEFFIEHESEIVAGRKAYGDKTRVIYRGPRYGIKPEHTLREDAVAVIIYGK